MKRVWIVAACIGILGVACTAQPPEPPPTTVAAPTTFTASFAQLNNSAASRFYVGWENPTPTAPLPRFSVADYPAGTKLTFTGTALWGMSALVGAGGDNTPLVTPDWLMCMRIIDQLSNSVLPGSEACSPITAPVAESFPWATVGTLPASGDVQPAPQFELVPPKGHVAPCIGISYLVCTPIYVNTSELFTLDTSGAATNPNTTPSPAIQPPYIEVPIGESVTVTTSGSCPTWRASSWTYYSGTQGDGPPVTLSNQTLQSVTVTANWQAKSVVVSCMSGSAFLDTLNVTVRP